MRSGVRGRNNKNKRNKRDKITIIIILIIIVLIALGIFALKNRSQNPKRANSNARATRKRRS